MCKTIEGSREKHKPMGLSIADAAAERIAN